ncbi:MAG: response regulator [Minwuia sp.]|nr:response regulator [Minwuia sp.]
MAFDRSRPVLIVDDYRDIVRLMTNLLRELGFSDIDGEANGARALRRLRSRDYALVLCDWNMTPMTGLQLLKEVRADEQLRKLPFIMVTGVNGAEHVQAAREAGVSNYIVKPFNVQAVHDRIEATVGRFAPITGISSAV